MWSVRSGWRGSVLQLLHGTFDAVSTASDHAKIAAVVNGAHPGRAEHRELEGLDHRWTRQRTPDAAGITAAAVR
jgi:hypothetical protein